MADIYHILSIIYSVDKFNFKSFIFVSKKSDFFTEFKYAIILADKKGGEWG